MGCKKMHNRFIGSLLLEIKPYAGKVIRLWDAVAMTTAPLLSSLF